MIVHIHLHDARGLNKSTIGKEAVRQLQMMAEMLAENNWAGADYHANSANNYMKSLEAAGMQSELPEIIKRNANHLRFVVGASRMAAFDREVTHVHL